MTGFINRLFGSKAKKEDTTAASNEPKPTREKPGAFFLDNDEAKTFGDIDYMRTSKSVRRTFPKTLSNPKGAARTEQISAMEMGSAKQENTAAPNQPAQPSPSPAEPQKSETASKRTDTSMDMFRNMARDIRKS